MKELKYENTLIYFYSSDDKEQDGTQIFVKWT